MLLYMGWIINLGRHNMTYGLLKTALDVSSLRQKTISSNISNMNTPGFKSNRVVFEERLKSAENGITLNHTHERHIKIDSNTPIVQRRENMSVQDNGNNVDIEYEMAELSANNIYYDAIVSQLNAKYAMTRTVIK